MYGYQQITDRQVVPLTAPLEVPLAIGAVDRCTLGSRTGLDPTITYSCGQATGPATTGTISLDNRTLAVRPDRAGT